MTMYTRELRVATLAAQAAARLIRKNAGRVSGNDVREKGYNDLVTTTDEAAQAAIIRILIEAFPQYGILAEEATGGAPSGVPRWIIDPIDGTINFTHGLPPFAVSIALEVFRQVQVGVVLEIASGELFTAIRGQGAMRNGEPIQVSNRPRLAQSLIATGFPYKDFGTVDQYFKVLQHFLMESRGVRRFGAASMDLAYVACGLFEGFFETGLRAWDVAAGTLIVTEAGGRVSDLSGNTDMLESRQIVASNTWVHEEMLLLLTPLRRAL